MRSGSYIQALGRQSFEPSQPALSNTFNLIPSQQSQERQRQLIKAQNDVLATVGVCLRDTKQSFEKSESLMAENEVGLLVGAVDLTVTYLASWPLVGIRNRLQVGHSKLRVTVSKLTVVPDIPYLPKFPISGCDQAGVEGKHLGRAILWNARTYLLSGGKPRAGLWSG